MEKRLLSRSSKILKFHVGKICHVHNGLVYKPILVNKNMVGFKAGEFVYTKKMSVKIHNQKNKKRKWVI